MHWTEEPAAVGKQTHLRTVLEYVRYILALLVGAPLPPWTLQRVLRHSEMKQSQLPHARIPFKGYSIVTMLLPVLSSRRLHENGMRDEGDN